MGISDDQLSQLLIQRGLLTPEMLAKVIEFAKNSDLSLEDALYEKAEIDEITIVKTIGEHYNIPVVNISKMQIPENIFHILPERIIRRYKIAVFARDENGIKIAMRDPTDIEMLTMVAFKTGQKVIPHLTTKRDIITTLQLYRQDLQTSFDELIVQEGGGKGTIISVEMAPITKIFDLLIDYAYQNKSSDVHLEPHEHHSLVRFRIDGVLHDVLIMPANFHDRVVTRIKVLSKLRTDEHLGAQDGKMSMQMEDENLDIRVSIIPIADGEKVVLRLLSSKAREYSLAGLGMDEDSLAKMEASYNRSFGMILSTGPTGSGKSTSIYAILKKLNTRERNITTIEDPIEYRLPGVNQIQVNTKANLTFASGLRSILRQDPNVIFVGEIRDSETAGIAVNAALTGHLVLSTLHTNDAATSLPRLIDMKIEPFLVASTVNIIIAQRLIRKICENCRTSKNTSVESLLKNFPDALVKKIFLSKNNTGDIKIYEGTGCKLCHMTGYRGRIGIFEVLEITPALKKLIVEKADSNIIEQQAMHEGMKTMIEDGLHKVAKGTTTLEEVIRVTKVEKL